ncbi:MAG: class I SAM-dependent methyltransferase [Actinomycetota bacterium]
MEPREYDIMYDLETVYWWHVGMRSIMDELISDTISPDSKLLDVGCGTGARLKALSELCDTWGIDFNSRAVELCKRRGLKNIILGDAMNLPYDDESFTHVVCCDVLTTLDDDLAAMKEAFRVLKPGGLYYSTEQAYPRLRTQHDVSQWAVRRYTKHHFISLLRTAGFQLDRITFANTIMFPALAVYRLFSKTLKPPSKVDPEHAHSDLYKMPHPINSILRQILELERKMIAKKRLPFGLTLIAVARKPSN